MAWTREQVEDMIPRMMSLAQSLAEQDSEFTRTGLQRLAKELGELAASELLKQKFAAHELLNGKPPVAQTPPARESRNSVLEIPGYDPDASAGDSNSVLYIP